MISKFLIAGFITISLFACNSNQPQVATGDNSQNSLDWNGTYTGITPCADCEGIETSVTLNKDMTYQLSNTYKGKSADAVVKTGTFTFDQDGNTITLGNITDGPSKYAVGENQITQLDLQGNKKNKNRQQNIEIFRKKVIMYKKTLHFFLLPFSHLPVLFSLFSLHSPPHRSLHSFPTRRSSDLLVAYEAMKRVGPTGRVVGNVYLADDKKVLDDLGVCHEVEIGRAHV